MDERTKQWAIRLGLIMATLAAVWVWTTYQMGNMAYMQLLTERQQGIIAKRQQLEANELELRRQRGECCDCSLIPEEEEGAEEER
jgi:type VI protein secretion system component VasK